MALSYQDLEKLQRVYPDYQAELRDGRIIIMSPADITSSIIGIRFGRFLGNWVDAHQLGQVSDSSGGFRFPNGDVLSPDGAFISRERLKKAPRSYPSLVPDLIMEIKSSWDSLAEQQEKVKRFLRLGVKVGILIDPDKRTVAIYRPGDSPEAAPVITILRSGDVLTVPELLPGWQVKVDDLWPPVFE